MAKSYRSFAATNEFEIYHNGIGPTGSRLALIAINTYMAIFGFEHFYWQMPLVVLVTVIALVIDTWQIHKKHWALDMQQKDS